MAKQQTGQFPGSLWQPHAHFWPGRGNHRIRYVIVHGTASPGMGTAQAIARYFQTTSRDTGTHYVIGKDGTVVQCVREEDAAWGNGIITAGHDPWWGSRGNPNLETISIEHVKTTSDNHEALTQAQMQASFRLIAYLCRKWGIPPRWADAAGGITGHFSIDRINRNFCPGPYPWEELFHQLVAPAEAPGLPTANGTFLTQGTSAQGLPTLPLGGSQTAGGATGTGETVGAALGPTAPLRSAGTIAHEALSEAPGFGGIVAALDSAEQFQPLRVSGVSDIFAWLGSNTFAVIVRLLLVALGVLLVVGLFAALARQNDWLPQAGGDVLPLMLGGR